MASETNETAQMVKLREDLNKARIEKELLRWEKAQAEAKLEGLEGISNNLELGNMGVGKTPTRPEGNVGKSHYKAVDSEVRFKVPQSMATSQQETSGYISQDLMVQEMQEEDYSPRYPSKQPNMSTPLAPRRN